MIDAPAEPFEKNVEITKRVVAAAHAKGIVVEAELGQLGGVEEHVKVDEANAKLTDPARPNNSSSSPAATAWLRHWHQPRAFKFSGSQACTSKCSPEIQKRLPGFPLSCTFQFRPAEEVAPSTPPAAASRVPRGVDAASSCSRQTGVTKINIDTDGRWCGRAFTANTSQHPRNFDLRPIARVFMSEYAKFIAEKNVKLGSAASGNGAQTDRVKPSPCSS